MPWVRTFTLRIVSLNFRIQEEDKQKKDDCFELDQIGFGRGFEDLQYNRGEEDNNNFVWLNGNLNKPRKGIRETEEKSIWKQMKRNLRL